MNISLKSRVNWSFAIVNIFILVLGMIVFFYLDSLNKDIEKITLHTKRIHLHTDQIRISMIAILRNQRKTLPQKDLPKLVEKINFIADGFVTQLERLDSLHTDTEIKKIISKMLGHIESLKLILRKTSLFHRDTLGVTSISDLSDEILDAFTELQIRQLDQSKKRNNKLQEIIGETKKTMMITLICTFLFTVLLGLIIPRKIALPFKKINDAIRELQECNFDVSIFYDQDDEIGEMALEMNKMIQSMKLFEELRTDRITIEHKKFDTLASLTKRYVLVANAKGELIYMNNQLYSLMDISSDEVLHKQISDILIPQSIREIYEMAIKRRTKIENATVEITRKKEVREEDKESDNNKKSIEDPNKQVLEEEKEILFKGYANVVPIRGKESSLDYYLMVLSPELFS